MTSQIPRRRFTAAAIVVSVLIAVGGTLVYAHSNGGPHGAMARQSAASHLEHLQAMLGRAGASDAQKSQIEALLKPALEDLGAARESHSAAFRQFHEAITAPSIDRARLEALRAAQLKSLDEASKRLVIAISDAAEVLSPDQRAALAAEIEKHHRG